MNSGKKRAAIGALAIFFALCMGSAQPASANLIGVTQGVWSYDGIDDLLYMNATYSPSQYNPVGDLYSFRYWENDTTAFTDLRVSGNITDYLLCNFSLGIPNRTFIAILFFPAGYGLDDNAHNITAIVHGMERRDDVPDTNVTNVAFMNFTHYQSFLWMFSPGSSPAIVQQSIGMNHSSAVAFGQFPQEYLLTPSFILAISFNIINETFILFDLWPEFNEQDLLGVNLLRDLYEIYPIFDLADFEGSFPPITSTSTSTTSSSSASSTTTATSSSGGGGTTIIYYVYHDNNDETSATSATSSSLVTTPAPTLQWWAALGTGEAGLDPTLEVIVVIVIAVVIANCTVSYTRGLSNPPPSTRGRPRKKR